MYKYIELFLQREEDIISKKNKLEQCVSDRRKNSSISSLRSFHNEIKRQLIEKEVGKAKFEK